MSDLEPKLAELSRIITEIEIELGRGQYTADELNLLKALIRKGQPLVRE